MQVFHRKSHFRLALPDGDKGQGAKNFLNDIKHGMPF